MKPLKYIVLASALTFSVPAWAQSTSEAIRDILFTEAEKYIIGEHYGVKVDDIAQGDGRPEWVVTTGRDDDDDDRDDDKDDDRDDDKDDDRDDDDDGRSKDKKDKSHKGKGKDKAKGKGKSKGLPPGLAKRDTLPPGLQKQLEKNGRLPAGLAKRDLPSDLASKLPKRDDSQEVTVVDNDVVLVDKATGVILDVLKDVITNPPSGGDGSDGKLAPPGPQSSTDTQDKSVLGKVLDGIFGD